MKLVQVVFRAVHIFAAVCFGYLTGSILTADIAARAANRVRGQDIDLRRIGSGNPGAANAIANLGTKWGLAVLAGDIAKGAVAGAGGRRIAGDAGAYAAAAAAVGGHCFPVWTKFRGGKGVATSTGTTLVVFPAYVPIDLGLVAISWAASRHAAKATLTASGLFVAAAAVWHRRDWSNLWGPKPTRGLPLYALATSAMIAYRFATAPTHLENLPNGAATLSRESATDA